MTRVLFVCLGNICRSPLAQGIFEEAVRREGLSDHFYADSAGTSGFHEGEKPDPGSINVARQNDIRIDHQRSRPVTRGDQHEFDYFIAMDENNRQSLISEFGIPPQKVIKIRQFDPEPESGNVPDPYGGGRENFQRVFDILTRSTGPLLAYLRQNQGI